MKRKLVCLFLCMTLLLTMYSSVNASEIEDNDEYAEEEYTMEGTPSLLRWSNVSSVKSVLSVSSGKASSSIIVQGYSKVTTIVVYTYFQKKVNGSWVNLSYVIDTKTGNFASVSRSTSSGIVKGYSYRVRASIYVYTSTTYEHITVYSNTVRY